MLYSANREPSLEEILGDPIVHLVMARDGVCEEELRALLKSIRCRPHEKRHGEAKERTGAFVASAQLYAAAPHE